MQQAHSGEIINALELTHNLLPTSLGNVQVLKKVEECLQTSHENGLQILLAIELELGNLIIELVPIENQWALFECLALNEHLRFLPVYLVLKLFSARVDMLHHFIFH